jgi:hypothetical protein
MAFNLTLRKSFLYIFATVGLIITIIGGVSLINLGLKTYVFTKADNYCYDSRVPVVKQDGTTAEPTQAQIDQDKKNCEEQRAASKQSQASNAIAMLIVGIPLYLYNWMTIKKENQV